MSRFKFGRVSQGRLVANHWNQRNPVGTLVRYWREDRKLTKEARTITPVRVTKSDTAMVWVADDPVGVPLTNLELVDYTPPSLSRPRPMKERT